MANITIYRFETYDPGTRSFQRSRDYATIDTIKAFGALAIAESALLIDDALMPTTGLLAGHDAEKAGQKPK